jgi:hypothetical protein
MQAYSHFFKTLHDETSPTGYLGRGTHYSVLRAVVFHDPMGSPLPEGHFTDFAVIWDGDHDTRVMEPIEEIYRRGMLSSFLMFGESKGSFTAILSEEVELSVETISFDPVFLTNVREFDLSERSANCLKNDNIVYVGDLVQKTDGEILRMPNMGRRSLDEVKGQLTQLGLHLGMEVPGWPPENIENLSKNEARAAFLRGTVEAICQSLGDPWRSEVAALDSERNPIIHDDDDRVKLYLETLKMLWKLGVAEGKPLTPEPRAPVVSNRRPNPAIDNDGNVPGWTADPSEADRDPFHR